CAVYDLSNACLGVMSGIIDVANAIELGQMRAGLVVACETAREINESMIASMLQTPTMEHFRLAVATLTGGSGAAAVLITDGSFSESGHRLLGGTVRAAPEHHGLCRWYRDTMSTDAAAVLKHGVALGSRTWKDLVKELGWTAVSVDKTVCHQVGAPHRAAVLSALGLLAENDFATYESLGNMGTVSLPITAAIAAERDFLRPGHKAAFLGIGSGLNCLMLGWQW
ncbi:MAG: 3-oxoacyl-ACP synthase III, partial [Elusimicrobiota bacterium]